MNIENIKTRNPLKVVLTMRISEEDSDFLRKNKISPQGLFRESITDLKKELKNGNTSKTK